MSKGSGGSVATFERFDLGGSLGEIRLKERTEHTPGNTFGAGYFKTEGGLSKFVLIVPVYFINTTRRPPTTVT